MEKNQENVFFFYPESKEGEPRRVIAGVYDPNTNTIKIAKSECSNKDRFNKAKGRAIALGRANCPRTLDVKFYQRENNKMVRSNSHLLPKTYNLNEVIKEDKSTTPMHQFIEIAKTI